MSEKRFPLNYEELKAVTQKYPTPFHLYDEHGIRESLRRFNRASRLCLGKTGTSRTVSGLTPVFS